ncbi:hypothetical protein JMUB6875_26240 [Nocardia sp. JMUB6875]|uniref:hypothetical protein n=1 Tax=Nocardia sp. JMUB6875 TaxID=3158170 RepID=UPI0032E5A22D
MRISLRGTGDGVRVNFRLKVNRRRWIALFALLGVLVAIGLITGLWALFAPSSFYDSFPGFGLHWVGGDGPYNHHLVTDVGAFFLALAAISGAALYYRDSVIARVSGFGWLVFGVPHLIYHAFHRGDLGAGAFTLELLSAVAIPALGLAILLVSPRERFPVPEPAPFTVKFPRRQPPPRR